MSHSRAGHDRCFLSAAIVLGGAAVIAAAAAPSAAAFTWPWEGSPWPRTSAVPVRPLDHPTLEDRLTALEPPAGAGYRFVTFGDQRALADGEWQAMIGVIDSIAAVDDRLLFALDTGDIVQDGTHSDQFEMLRGILSPLYELPYIVGVGNHEVHNNRPGPARANTAAFLSYLDPALAADRFYYRKDAGPVRLLVLDTNDLVYGDDGGGVTAVPAPGSRGEGQMEWLFAELEASRDFPGSLVAVMHHPIVQSSKKHQEAARLLWTMRYRGRALPDILADGGVDVVLCGHSHTFERFRMRRVADGATLHVVNFSGRPRTTFLWMGDGARAARDIRGREREWLAERGWGETEKWEISQLYAMTSDDANQFGIFTVGGDGSLELEVIFTGDEAPAVLHREPAMKLE